MKWSDLAALAGVGVSVAALALEHTGRLEDQAGHIQTAEVLSRIIQTQHERCEAWRSESR